MKLRLIAMLLAVPAVVSGALVAMPAEALTYDAAVPTRNIAISTSGLGKVTVQCFASKTCKGKLSFTNASTRVRDYSVPAHSSRTMQVAVRTTEAAYPYASNGGIKRGDVYYKNAVLVVNQDYPRNKTRTYNVTTETLLTAQQITGVVNGPVGHEATDVKVELVRSVRGGNTEVVRSADVPDGGGTYKFTVGLGSNNSPSGAYKVRVSGLVANADHGTTRSWYWRGSDGSTTGGGGRYLDEGSTVRATKMGDFNANFLYGSITGSVTNSIPPNGRVDITVAAPPRTYSSNSKTRREYDFPYCGNVYGTTDAASGGTYRVDFLPLYTGTKRYMVRTSYGSVENWNPLSSSTTAYGSCLDVMNYERSTSNLIAFNGSTTIDYDVRIRRGLQDLYVNSAFSGFSSTVAGDRQITIREKVPGLPVLSAPVVARGTTNSNGNGTIQNLMPGKYWVEVGRRTSCSAWYPSVFTDNNAYFSGADRGSERWKTVAGAAAEYQKSYDMGYVKRTPPSGYKGWMYRGYCKALGTGTYNNTVSITSMDAGTTTEVTSTIHKGAVVRGHVKRAGGKTNKEMMVRLSSSDGKRVIRTDLTDSSGNFYVAGLPSGSWTISVNSDSWRGIGRTFTGKHSISVTSGHTYNAGTLYFKG